MARRSADDAPAMLQKHVCIFDQPWAHGRGGRREARHAVALLAAQQLVPGHAERLAGDVMERDVDGRDCADQYPPALEILAAIHLLPERPAAEGVFAMQELAIVLDRAGDRLLAARDASFAPTVQTLV